MKRRVDPIPTDRELSGNGLSSVTLPSSRLARRLRDCYRIFTVELQLRLSPHGMRVSDWAHLRTIVENEGSTHVELSRRLGIEKASSTAVLEKLKSAGIVFGRRQKADQRKIGIYLTPHGRTVVERLLDEVILVNTLATKSIDPDEMARFFGTLDKIVHNLETASGEDSLDTLPSIEKLL